MRPQSHGHGHDSKDRKVGSSSVVTRSRSASASSSRTSSSSSSSSSGSDSSSSSSSGSDSDSSSSDTEGSQDSRASRASRASESSKKGISQPNIKSQQQKPTPPPNKHKEQPKKSPEKKNELKQQSHDRNSQPKQKASVPPTPRSHGQTKLPNKPSSNKPTPSPVPPKPIKNPQKPSPSLTKVSSTTTSKALANFKKKNKTLGSSSESESSSAVSTPVKRVGSKPVATVSIITSKQLPDGNTSQKKISVVGAKTPNVKNITIKPKKVNNSSKDNNVSSTKKSIVSHSKKSSKSTTTDNSSEESDDLSKRKIKLSGMSMSIQNSGKPVKGNLVSHRKPDKRDSENRLKKPSPVPKPVSSSSLSESGTTTSTSSSEDSGSESEKKSDVDSKIKNSTNIRESSPKSPSSSGRKRVITRRRTVKSKTIATTTIINASALSVQSNSHSQNSLTVWSSDDYSGGSDDQNHYAAARVPAKTSYKPRPRTTDDEDELEMERKCPYPCCDSSGHLSGEFPTHSMLSTCPKYQGFQAEECKENANERRLRETERKKFSNILHPRKSVKLSMDASNWVERIGDLKERESKEGVTAYDMSLWVDGLAVAARKIEEEQAAGIGYRSVVIGKFEMSCWCESPYPDTLSHSRRIFICEFCLKPAPSGTILRRHCTKCVWRHPPGDEIYRKDRISVWEVDGKTQKTYCQNLCLLAKCFLDHKTLYLDVDPFLFYVMTLADSQGCHLVGYFSKEKNSFLNYNVSCILTLPPYQRKGFGRLLIDFSYLLTRVEGKVGSPEKPLSDLGLISYRSYWKDAVLRRMCACATREMIVKDLSIELGVASADIISTLQFLGMLKYWKGKHIVLKKQDVIEEYMERVRRRGEARTIDPNCLRWRPFQPPAENST